MIGGIVFLVEGERTCLYAELGLMLENARSRGVHPFLFMKLKQTFLFLSNLQKVYSYPFSTARWRAVSPFRSLIFRILSRLRSLQTYSTTLSCPLSTATWRKVRPKALHDESQLGHLCSNILMISSLPLEAATCMGSEPSESAQYPDNVSFFKMRSVIAVPLVPK